jgi:hypothetical protein
VTPNSANLSLSQSQAQRGLRDGRQGASLLIRACSTGKADTVRQLLQDGISPDTTDEYGLTGLIWAGRKGQVEIAKALVEAGADLESKDRTGRTALFHAVVFNRHEFVEYVASQGALLSPIDMHGCTPLDAARWPEGVKKADKDRMVELLTRLGAKRKGTQEPTPPDQKKWNAFISGGYYGGPDLPLRVDRIDIQLSAILHKWTGNYTQAVENFYLTKYVDGSLMRHTKQMQLIGPGKPHRVAGAMYVKIGIPEDWWSQDESRYKALLADALEEGLRSSIAMLQRNKHSIDAERLLADWAVKRKESLDTPAPPFAAETQRAMMLAFVEQAKRAVEERKVVVVTKAAAARPK